MKSTIKEHLVSMGLTFGATFGGSFLIFICLAVQDSSFTFSREALASLILSALVSGFGTAIRAVAKVILESYRIPRPSDN